MLNRFEKLLKNVATGDETARSKLKNNLDLLVSQYFIKKYIELDWVAFEKEICLRKNLFELIFEKFVRDHNGNLQNISSFSEYKKNLISISEELINEMFKNYFNLLEDDHTKAWTVFDRILKVRINNWLYKKGYSNNELHSQFYQDAQTVFCEKINKEDLSFSNSRLLKSYFFKIIQLKLYEYNRDKRKTVYVELKETNIDDSEKIDPVIYDSEEKKYFKKMINSLKDIEKKILVDLYFHENKLRDIANKLGITESNCRVIKHRALAKLEKSARKYDLL